LIQDVKFDVDL